MAEINNWTKWQSFRKDRGTPPWIKIYRNLLSNCEWAVLSDAEKGQLISLWILAADKNGVIPDDPSLIQKMTMLDKPPDLNKFSELGFVSTKCQPHDNQVTHQSRVEERRVEKSRVEERSNKFDGWWSQYPKKVKRKKAKEIWMRNEFDADILIADTMNKAQNDSQWLRGYMPDPTTYLNGELWNDDIQNVRNKNVSDGNMNAVEGAMDIFEGATM